MKIEFQKECESCHGTGLYRGIGERDGAAVVCHTCKGTGCCQISLEYTPFMARKNTNGVKRVFQVNVGVGIGEGNGHTLEGFGGISYKDWKNEQVFPRGSEMRKYTCPAWWYQGADYNRKPDWDECNCLGSTFSKCSRFNTKDVCWERFDQEEK